jgi:hypothetical protein
MTEPGAPLVVFNYPQVVSGVLHYAMADHVRLFVVRVDLCFPQRMALNQIPGNEVMGRFIKALRGRVNAHRQRVMREYSRACATRIRFAWVRIFAPYTNRPYYHLMLTFNRDAYRTLGNYRSNEDSLARCIQGAWTGALNVDFSSHRSLARFLKNGQYEIINGGGAQQVMDSMMYLCKDYSDVWNVSRNIGYSLARQDLLSHRCSIQCLH